MSYPKTRPRRLRATESIRRLVAESALSASDLIYPVFIQEGSGCDAIESMPGQRRLDRDGLLAICESLQQYAVPAIALFPVICSGKTECAKESYNDNGLIQRTVRDIKSRFPDLLVITDVALDPYTTHGQDGLINEAGYVLNDETVDILMKQALSHASVGADIVAPSDMMDGRIGCIRDALESHNFPNTLILAYAAKYCSGFYYPFRDAVNSATALGGANKKTYQMDPANSLEAIGEVELDISEGADMVMIKPAMPCLDIISQCAQQFTTPVFAYQVSGEYSMLLHACEQGFLPHSAIYESLLSIKRAGARAILSYFALDIARELKTI